ncbi:MAG TPA: hypothetical protein VN829_10910 [Dongiaceae bacterium]|nr:hypothetical protein [Dongiaceae bacterium]
MKRIAIIVSGFVWLGALSGVAGEVQQVNPYSVAFGKIAAAELPASAAALVKKATARESSGTTVNAVQAALQANAKSACAVVSAISRSVPEMAPIAAGTAVQLQPKRAVAIAQAAAAAAPSQAAQIVVAVCRAAPKSYRLVAVAVANAVPGSNRAILAALSSAFPELKTGLDNALANYNGQPPSVGLTLDQTGVVALVSAVEPIGVRGPASQPPFVPLGSGVTPYQADNDTQDPVPPGGAQYALPSPP